MPILRKSVPAYLLHKQSGRGRAVWTDESGVRREKLLPGKFDSPESRAAYGRVVAELAVTGAVAPKRNGLTVAEVLHAYLLHAETHYRGADGRTTPTYREYKRVVHATRLLYAATSADQFGPLAMKSVRQTWVDAGLARSEVNRRTKMLRRIFKWASEEELIPASAYLALTTVSGLQKGRTTARESERILPVSDADVDATLPYLKPHARALIEFMRHTGCRPCEACLLRPCDIRTEAHVWQYRPQHHKNAHRGLERSIAIGPRARDVIAAMTPDEPASYFFSPRHDVQHFRAARRASRVTTLYDSHLRHIAAKRVENPKRAAAEFYTSGSLCVAVRRAVEKANRARESSLVEVGPNLPQVAHWHPNQLRHSVATRARAAFGLEAAQAVLGHARADVTQIYAEILRLSGADRDANRVTCHAALRRGPRDTETLENMAFSGFLGLADSRVGVRLHRDLQRDSRWTEPTSFRSVTPPSCYREAAGVPATRLPFHAGLASASACRAESG